MRILILSAFLAVAVAAPSGNLLLVQPAVIPTISPGDIQAAAIDAQVQAEDNARAFADKNQELADQAVENTNEKTVTDANIAQERSLEAFWSAEDQKWQAIDAVQTAAAKIDGAIASNADQLAKYALGGGYVVRTPVVGPLPAQIGPLPAQIGPLPAQIGPLPAQIAPISGSISGLVYSPYIAGLSGVAVSTQNEIRTEIKEEDNTAIIKAAEPEKPAEPAPIEPSPSERRPAEPSPAEEPKPEEPAIPSPAVKAQENLDAKPAVTLAQRVVGPLALANIGLANLKVGVPTVYGVPGPAVGQVLAQPLQYTTTVQQIHGVVAPTLLKTVW